MGHTKNHTVKKSLRNHNVKVAKSHKWKQTFNMQTLANPLMLMNNFRHDRRCRKSPSERKPPQNAALWFIHLKVSKLQLIFKKTQNN